MECGRPCGKEVRHENVMDAAKGETGLSGAEASICQAQSSTPKPGGGTAPVQRGPPANRETVVHASAPITLQQLLEGYALATNLPPASGFGSGSGSASGGGAALRQRAETAFSAGRAAPPARRVPFRAMDPRTCLALRGAAATRPPVVAGVAAAAFAMARAAAAPVAARRSAAGAAAAACVRDLAREDPVAARKPVRGINARRHSTPGATSPLFNSWQTGFNLRTKENHPYNETCWHALFDGFSFGTQRTDV